MPSKKRKSKQQQPSGVAIDRDELAGLAYELYERRGGEHGHDVEDWLEAELILREKISRSNGRRARSHPMRRLEDQFGAR